MILFPLSAQSGATWQRVVTQGMAVWVEGVLTRGDLMEENGKGEQKCSGTWGAVSESFLGVSEDFVSRCWPDTVLGALRRQREVRSQPLGTFTLVIPVFA